MAQSNKKIELTETQLHRLLWLIDRTKECNLAPEIAELLNLVLGPDYTGDIGMVIMAVEKDMLELLNRKADIKERIKEKNKNAEILRFKVIFNGNVRIDWPKGVSDDTKEKVGDAFRYIREFELPVVPAKKAKRYILIDKVRAEEHKEVLRDISKKWGIKFVTQRPKNVSAEDIIALVDPEDADKDLLKDIKVRYILPLIYMRASFILAAELAVTDGRLEDTQAFEFVKVFYENFLGQEMDKDEVELWFEKPWLLKDKIKSLTKELKYLRFAISELDKSA